MISTELTHGYQKLDILIKYQYWCVFQDERIFVYLGNCLSRYHFNPRRFSSTH